MTVVRPTGRPGYAWYSVDASIMVKLKDMLPQDLFTCAWNEVERLVDDGRWRMYEYVANEVHGDLFQAWLRARPAAVVGFGDEFNRYMNALMSQLDAYGLRMVNPESERDKGDPFVVALALMLERRDLSDLQKRTQVKTCCVLTNEKPKQGKVNIPSVCKFYGLPYMDLFEFMRHHGWTISLTVTHPE